MNKFRCFLENYKAMDNYEQSATINHLNGLIERIATSRSGNGAYFGSNRTSIKEVLNTCAPYFYGNRPSYHATIQVYYKDGSKEFLDNDTIRF